MQTARAGVIESAKTFWNSEFKMGSVSHPVMALEEKVKMACNVSGVLGVETISFPGISTLSIESLITSATPFDKSLLIANNSSRGNFIKRIASINKVHYFELFSYEKQMPDIGLLEEFLAKQYGISYMILPLISINGIERVLFDLSKLLETYGVGLIVDYYGKLDTLSIDFLEYQIQCMSITPSDLPFKSIASSVILAQRKFIASCKGNSKTYSLDLYNAWQKKIWNKEEMM